MMTSNQLRAAPAVALIISFVTVFSLGRLFALSYLTVDGAREGNQRIELNNVRAGTSFSEEGVDATVRAADGREVEVCLKLPDKKRIADPDWNQLDPPSGATFCRKTRQHGDLEVWLVRK
jgi:hypothetical protein